METLIISVPDQKCSIVKLLLKELGVTIQNKSKAKQLGDEINSGIKTGPKPGLDEIIAEVNDVRQNKYDSCIRLQHLDHPHY